MMRLVKNSQGQVSIFLGATIIVLITFIAMVINIGLFVKAKINLQNAVDAAAWSGAAVQARQLTNIAYLNWEMRNVYKEWLFKYYVLGNLSIEDIETADLPPDNGSTSFRLKSIDEGNTANQGAFGKDIYNFPSICVNFETSGSDGRNICRLYSLPGLPVFEETNMIGADQITQAFTNTIAAAKLEACSNRSLLNFLTANLWTYQAQGSSENSIASEAPLVASQRPGAFPKAIELAYRIRSLEAFVNQAPIVQGTCNSSGRAAGSCQRQITEYESENHGGYERVVKAFYSGYRNLGGSTDQEMKDSFTLTELPPTPYTVSGIEDLSTLLIPDGPAKQKYYLDLKLIPVNYSIFYTNLTSRQGGSGIINSTAGDVNTTAGCDSSKVSLPVPGYPLGFTKNPDVLTYYAVRGEANWMGLFNPFDISNEGIKLTAYAAAKPFGGRIGPVLFKNEGSEVKAREGLKKSSKGYVIGMNYSQVWNSFTGDTEDIPETGTPPYISGAPVPLSRSYWLDDPGKPVGGWLQAGSSSSSGGSSGSSNQIRFALPNLIYDYVGDSPDGATLEGAAAELIQILTFEDASPASPEAGLFNGAVFKKFKRNLSALSSSGGGGASVGVTDIIEAIHKVRRPTLYEAYNYLIPSPEEVNASRSVTSFGIASRPPRSRIGNGDLYNLGIYAPLYGENGKSLYERSTLTETLESYLGNQTSAIQIYKEAMYNTAVGMSGVVSPNDSSAKIGLDAANVIYDTFPLSGGARPPSCKSITGKFIQYYLGPDRGTSEYDTSHPSCSGRTTMSEELLNYWTDNSNNVNNIYNIQMYLDDNDKDSRKIFTAYAPGEMHDSIAGEWRRSIGPSERVNMRRNYYSTKLVALTTLGNSGSNSTASSPFPIISEGNTNKTDDPNLEPRGFANPLNAQALGIELNDIYH